MRRLLQVIIAVELAYATFLVVTWLQTGELAAGLAALIDVLAIAGCGAVWALARRGRPVAAASMLALGVFGVAIPLAAVPPATPALVVLPLFGTAIALQYVGGRLLHRLMTLSWITTVAIAFIVELVPAGGPQPAWYYPLMRISSFGAVIGITLVLLVQFGSRLRHGLAAAEAATEALRCSEAHYRTLVADAPLAIVVVDQEWRVVEANPTAERLMRQPAADFLGRRVDEIIEPHHLAAHPVRLAQLALGEVLHSEQVLIDGEGTAFYVEVHSALLDDGRYQLIIEDISERKRAEADRARLAQAVEQSVDSILITDPSATIVYVNPAFERASGYSRAEAIGAKPSILKSGKQDSELYRAMWAELAAGRPWSGELVNRRKDGTFYREQATISPVRDAQGALVNYVALQRDITRERTMEADLALETQVRAVLTTALHHVQAEASLGQAAQAICEEIARLPIVDVVAILAFEGADDVATFALYPEQRPPIALGSRLPAGWARHVRERAPKGPWAEYCEPDTEDASWTRAVADGGLRAVAFGPIVHGDHVEAVLLIGTSDPEFARTLVERTPVVAAFSTTSSALLAERLRGRRRDAERRAELGQVLRERTFQPVYQPIVDLASREVIGYEALTRFDSGERPDACFAAAWHVGLGPDLELATLEAAVRGAASLPAARWLDVNVAPKLFDEAGRIRDILELADRPIVIEITEHTIVEDHQALRDAVRALGPNVRLAVDDAGAGVANFSHIVELRPDFVKLDLSLVRGVNVDAGRQALVVAMHHFARTAGCRLVGEGIETDAEAQTLYALGVEFGQGYLLGRPAAAKAFAAQRRSHSRKAA